MKIKRPKKINICINQANIKQNIIEENNESDLLEVCIPKIRTASIILMEVLAHRRNINSINMLIEDKNLSQKLICDIKDLQSKSKLFKLIKIKSSLSSNNKIYIVSIISLDGIEYVTFLGTVILTEESKIKFIQADFLKR